MRIQMLLLLFVVTVLTANFMGDQAAGQAHPPAAPQGVELRVLGHDRWCAGGPVSLRVIAYDPHDSHGVSDVPIEITVRTADTDRPAIKVHGTTNEQGTLDTQLHVPDTLRGTASLRVVALREGVPTLETQIQVRREQRIFLTTDKPLYQPGQTIHIRALALREPALTPVAETPLLIEIEDAKANKVFKHHGGTDRFGVAATTFELANEVNMGEYHVRCTLGEGSAAASVEKSVTVKKYVLPKFKIACKTEKVWYLPNEVIKGTVQADYFFGKPVANANVTIEARAFDVEARTIGTLRGTTNASGTYAFELKLPDYLVGQPLDKGKANVALAIHLLDGTQHAEETGTQVAVVSQPISVELFPESGHLVPDLPNKIYVLTTRPDGSPAPAAVRLQVGTVRASTSTDATGFGEMNFTPPKTLAGMAPSAGRAYARRGSYDVHWNTPLQPLSATVVARDAEGNEVSASVPLSIEQVPQSLIIRPDKALYRVGEVFRAQLLTSKKSGDVYVDFIRDNQTILTQSVEVQNGHATLSFPLTADTYGAITVHAYQIQASSDVVRDTRKIFVQPARDLLVTVSADKATYRPGEDSKLTFMVKDTKGVPQLAVLGVDIVDESLFALAERQPGLERVYFLLEKEMMASRYEVHGLGLSDVVREHEKAVDPQRQRLSQALFVQMPAPAAYPIHLDTYRTRLQQMYERMSRVQSAAYTWKARHGGSLTTVQTLVEEGLLSAADANDGWGRPFGLRNTPGNCVVYSVGPDGLAGTSDDVDFLALSKSNMIDEEGGAIRFRGGAARAAEGVEDGPHPWMPPMAKVSADAIDRQERDREPPLAWGEARKDERLASKSSVRVREFFPETLFTAPQVVTDGNGRATVRVPMADSITTWRLSAFASSLAGKMGNASGALRVFQDFFVDIDAPVSLTQNDDVSIPVAVYNYLPEAQTVTLRVDPGEGYALLDGGVREVKLDKNQVTGVSFRIRAQRPGSFPLTVHATGSKLSDAIRRQITVVPDGREFVQTKSDRLNGHCKMTVRIPADAVPFASKMLVTLYPGVFSQVVEGLESILRMPGGCFEQTSSTTYPNVLVTGYLRKMRKTTPEIGMKADGYINLGYQRLLTFEVPGGGFSVFGQAPANPILTAYGLMEFADMAKVHDVDLNLLARTRGWLLAQQDHEGAWKAGRQGFYAEGWSNVPNSDLVATAYIAWALIETGEKSKEIERAVDYIKKHVNDAQDPYTAALTANALVAWNPHDPMALRALDQLLAMRIDDNDSTYWRTAIATAAYGTGKAGDIETTALAALALLSTGNHSNVANRALAFLVRSKDAYGTWQSTQATVLAMKALIASVDKAAEKTNARVTVVVNGQKAGAFDMTPQNFDVFKQLDVSSLVAPGPNDVVLNVEGSGNAMFKVATHCWRPWTAVALPPNDVLAIDVAYDRTTLAKDDTATCRVKVTNLTKRVANQVMVDVGVPPGFDVKGDDLEALVKQNVISKFSLTGRQVIIYLDRIDGAHALNLTWHIKARFPVRAQAPASRAYEYYNPERSAVCAPQLMVIK